MFAGRPNNVNIRSGDYFPIDLARPPFDLPPLEKIAEGTPDKKYLYLYRREALAEALERQGRL